MPHALAPEWSSTAYRLVEANNWQTLVRLDDTRTVVVSHDGSNDAQVRWKNKHNEWSGPHQVVSGSSLVVDTNWLQLTGVQPDSCHGRLVVSAKDHPNLFELAIPYRLNRPETSQLLLSTNECRTVSVSHHGSNNGVFTWSCESSATETRHIASGDSVVVSASRIDLTGVQPDHCLGTLRIER